MRILTVSLFLTSAIAYSQAIMIDRVTSDPPGGVCNSRANLRWNQVNNKEFGCDGTGWVQLAGAGTPGTVPAGSILIIISGTCPATYTEVAALDGFTLLGTLAAHSNVGTTGGSDSITPTGSVSAPTFTGTALGTHTHTTTATGTNSSPTFTGNSFDNRSAYTKVIFCSKN